MKYIPLFYTLLLLLLSVACSGQLQRPPDVPLPLERFKMLSYEPPAPADWAALKIPFLDGDKYGLADAEGNILVEPQFEDVEWLEWDLPIFAAKKGEVWAFYGLDGRQALPFSSDAPHELAINKERKGFRFDERGVHIEQLITRIKDPQMRRFTDPSGASKSASVYYFINPNTRKPYRGWFVPDHHYYIISTRDRWVPSIFTSDFQGENLKVMDENGRFAILDRNGNLIQPPVRNCATIGSPEKILILDDQDRIALRDVKRGWQTDFMFHNVETTPEQGLFLGKILEKGQQARLFSIDSMGRVTPFEGMSERDWLEKVPKSSKKPQRYQISWDTARAVLTDLQTGNELFYIAHGSIGNAGSGFFEVEKDKKHGWIDSTGRLLMPVEFDQLIGIWQDRRMVGIKNGLAGYFDMETGREILPVQFPKLNRVAFTQGRGVGFQLRSGKDAILATKDLEIVGQAGPNAPIKLSHFRLPENQSAAIRADFEKAALPEYFASVVPIMGPKWLHLFRCDGQHITSIETGQATVKAVNFGRYEHFLDEGNSFFTGFAQVRPMWPAKPYYVRMLDGKVFKK